jgi:ABC-type branched-subunit amino acid transport system ATPase component
VKVVHVRQVRSWAGLLAGEAREPDWLQYSYVVPGVLNDIALELENNFRGLIGLVGPQGVGKSSALLALQSGIPFSLRPSSAVILFKSPDVCCD